MACATSPTLLLFIGLKLQLAPSLTTALIVLVLLVRTAVGLLLAAAVNTALGCEPDQALGWLLFLQSACSFWPYTSMSQMGDVEKVSKGTGGRQGARGGDGAEGRAWDGGEGMGRRVAK